MKKKDEVINFIQLNNKNKWIISNCIEIRKGKINLTINSVKLLKRLWPRILCQSDILKGKVMTSSVIEIQSHFLDFYLQIYNTVYFYTISFIQSIDSNVVISILTLICSCGIISIHLVHQNFICHDFYAFAYSIKTMFIF